MACASTDSSQAQLNPLLSDHSDVVPPDPIPNSAVKRASAHGSAAQAVRESVIAEHLHPTPTCQNKWAFSFVARVTATPPRLLEYSRLKPCESRASQVPQFAPEFSGDGASRVQW